MPNASPSVALIDGAVKNTTFFLGYIPIESSAPSLFSKLSLSSIISGTSKTLNLVNQAIPVVKQVSPMMKNLKTMFNVMNEFKKTELPEQTKEIEPIINTQNVRTSTNDEGPTFFI